jgi:cellulose synthase/poly-beta-1,6-N-acetylglucosamine synthase-like glycosyltransferase
MAIHFLLQVLFWCSFLALIYSYLIYPSVLAILARGKKMDTQQFTDPSTYPQVSVLMAVHNEEAVIEEKLNSLFQQDYPAGKLHIYLGSDNSTDRTNEIIASFTEKYAHLHFFLFGERQGKPGVINQLAEKATTAYPAGPQHVFIITDASVMLSERVCAELVKHFRHPQLAIVDAQMLHTGMQAVDISGSENNYISWEGRLKYYESVLWKKMIGPFGGCYALRSDFFARVPDNFLVDDFYITLQAFRRGGLAIKEPAAICYEPVGHELKEEFRRKARISAGNLQNMFTFPDLWLPPVGLPNFPFFSHKILRWLGPIWLVLLWLTAGLLWHNQFYALLFVLLTSLYLLTPLVDEGLKAINIHWALLRNVRYFLTMNLALLAGYIRYVKGIKSNVWQPPKRE